MTSQPAEPAAAGPSTGSHRTRTVVLIAVAAAVVAGLVGLGIGGLGGVLLSSGGIGGGDRTDHDIAAGCAILDRVEDDLPVEEGSISMEEPLIYELNGAGHLFIAAGAGDPHSETWLSGKKLVVATSMADADRTNESIQTLQTTICD